MIPSGDIRKRLGLIGADELCAAEAVAKADIYRLPLSDRACVVDIFKRVHIVKCTVSDAPERERQCDGLDQSAAGKCADSDRGHAVFDNKLPHSSALGIPRRFTGGKVRHFAFTEHREHAVIRQRPAGRLAAHTVRHRHGRKKRKQHHRCAYRPDKSVFHNDLPFAKFPYKVYYTNKRIARKK